MANIQIVFGSNSGNTKMVCEYIAVLLQEAAHQVAIHRCEHFPEDHLTGHDLLILGCSTYEHGELEDHFKKSFWPRIQHLDLQGQRCAVVGLGDSRYDTDYNIESANILEEYVKSHKGTLLCEALKINKSPLPQLENKVKDWTNTLITKI